tara:strand:+ start:352 stop:954 length:603 start_codon:yes stop_codon:yes gene_type:complete
MSNVHLLFPTPLYESFIKVKSTWITYVKNLKYKRTTSGDAWITSDINILKHQSLSDLHDVIKSKIEDFAYGNLGVAKHVKIKIVRSWVMKHNFNDSALRHYHSNSIFSGIYYLEVFPDSGNVVFEKSEHYPNCFMSTFQPDIETQNQINTRVASIQPLNGTLLIFPSQVLHRVEKNNTRNDRYCIAFDAFVENQLVTDGL